MNTLEGRLLFFISIFCMIMPSPHDSSDRLTDEAISIAIATKENLSHQRGMFSGAAGRMGAVACIFQLLL